MMMEIGKGTSKWCVCFGVFFVHVTLRFFFPPPPLHARYQTLEFIPIYSISKIRLSFSSRLGLGIFCLGWRLGLKGELRMEGWWVSRKGSMHHRGRAKLCHQGSPTPTNFVEISGKLLYLVINSLLWSHPLLHKGHRCSCVLASPMMH